MVSGEGQGLWRKRIVRAGILLVGSYAIMRHMAQKCIEPECIDQENPYISLGNNNRRDYREQKDDRQGQNVREAVPVYEGRIKPFFGQTAIIYGPGVAGAGICGHSAGGLCG